MRGIPIKSVLPALVVVLLNLSPGIQAHAAPILYTFTGIGTGTFNGQRFTNASFIIGAFADTANVQLTTDLYTVGATSSAISVTGLGLDFFTNPKDVFCRWTYLGFSQSTNNAIGYDLLDVADNSFTNYDLQSARGPLAHLNPQPGTLAFNEPTTLGVVSFDSFNNITFTAATNVPAAPQITADPTNQTVLAGDPATISLQVSGALPMAFYWQHDGVAVPGSANPLLLTNVQAADAGDYVVIVTNMFGSATGQVATLTVSPSAPNFKAQPVSQGLMPGASTARFSATVNGTSPVYWQWYFKNSPITNANSSQLTLTNVQNTDLGDYWAVVTNVYGAATSSVATLVRSSVLVWGNFDSQNSSLTNMPASLTNVIAMAAGDSHAVALKADGTVVAWGNGASGQTNVPPDLTNVVSVAAGSIHSLVLKSDGTLALWGKIPPPFGNPAFSKPPADATNIVALALGPGAQHALILRSDGTVSDWGDISYGLSNAPPTARNIVAVASGATYALALRADGRVVYWGSGSFAPPNASNIVAIATSWFGSAALRADGTVLTWGMSTPPPQFTNIVDIVCPFNSPSDALGLRRNGTLLEYSKNPAAYPTNSITAIAAGSYTAFAAVGDGPPVFPGLPINRTVPTGSRAYFRAVAAGAMPINYQWTCNGTNVPGATNTFLALTNVQPVQSGSYYSLVASNTFGVATNGAMFLNEVPVEFSIQPQSLGIAAGGSTTFAVTNLFGVGPFTYQWQCNNTNISGATNASLSLTNLQWNQSGTYSVAVSNGYGTVTNGATLSVVPLLFNTPGTMLTTNGFQFSVNFAYATNAVVIFASTDLVNWVPVLTNPPGGGPVFFDSGATNFPQRFYRAVTQ